MIYIKQAMKHDKLFLELVSLKQKSFTADIAINSVQKTKSFSCNHSRFRFMKESVSFLLNMPYKIEFHYMPYCQNGIFCVFSRIFKEIVYVFVTRIKEIWISHLYSWGFWAKKQTWQVCQPVFTRLSKLVKANIARSWVMWVAIVWAKNSNLSMRPMCLLLL